MSVLKFPEPRKPARILAEAAGANLETVVVIGFTKEGGFYTDCVSTDGAEVLWLLEKAKQIVLENGR